MTGEAKILTEGVQCEKRASSRHLPSPTSSLPGRIDIHAARRGAITATHRHDSRRPKCSSYRTRDGRASLGRYIADQQFRGPLVQSHEIQHWRAVVPLLHPLNPAGKAMGRLDPAIEAASAAFRALPANAAAAPLRACWISLASFPHSHTRHGAGLTSDHGNAIASQSASIAIDRRKALRAR